MWARNPGCDVRGFGTSTSIRLGARRLTRIRAAPAIPVSAAPSPAASTAAIHSPFCESALCPYA